MLRKQFGAMVVDLRAELGRSTDTAAHAADISQLQQTIKRVYETLYDDYDWPHLRIMFDRIPLSAGVQHYDVSDDVDFDKIERVVVWWNGQPHDIERGIDFEQYATYDPEADDRTDPVQRWDVRFDSQGEQEVIEVWPLPASNDQELQFRGKKKFVPLVDNANQCLIDDRLVVLYSAVELLSAKNPGRAIKLAAAQARYARLKGRSKSGVRSTRIGLGEVRPQTSHRAIVRVSG